MAEVEEREQTGQDSAVADHIRQDPAWDEAFARIRDLIHHDMQRAERSAFERLKAELQRAFSAPESAFGDLRLEDVLAQPVPAPFAPWNRRQGCQNRPRFTSA